MTAWDLAKRWGIVPEYKPDPENREKAREEFRRALMKMRKEYRERASKMRKPPYPGKRPPLYEGAPKFPEAMLDPKTPEEFEEENRRHREFDRVNNEWLDTVFFPGEAERVIWEEASAVLEEWRREQRAQFDLWKDEVYAWLPTLVKIGVGIAVVGGCLIVCFNLLGG